MQKQMEIGVTMVTGNGIRKLSTNRRSKVQKQKKKFFEKFSQML